VILQCQNYRTYQTAAITYSTVNAVAATAFFMLLVKIQSISGTCSHVSVDIQMWLALFLRIKSLCPVLLCTTFWYMQSCVYRHPGVTCSLLKDQVPVPCVAVYNFLTAHSLLLWHSLPLDVKWLLKLFHVDSGLLFVSWIYGKNSCTWAPTLVVVSCMGLLVRNSHLLPGATDCTVSNDPNM
jgi:hypothetical protein